MPLPHRSPPRRRDRRSRSRSHSPRRRRSRSHSRDRRRSRSPQRRRSSERKYRSPPRRKSPSPRRRSRSPKRRSRSHSPRRRSRSHSPRRKGHSPRRSPSPARREHPVKRPADSSGKRPGFRSRTPSPSPIKRSRDERLYEDEKLYQQQQRSNQARSPIHESQYGGKMYADQASSSKQPLFPSGSSKKFGEIDYVTIVEKGPRKLKLDKRFETLEEAAQGAFEFDENITIGIHRGPQHIQLDDDEDIEVNYGFNPKTFKMLHAKKNYNKEIFDRDEIKVFRHDDNLDEEAYVEKRTISVKPVDKPKSRKYNDEFDYKITVGSNREGYGDRRMVQDSGSRSRPSRSGAYDDIPVTVRLDPKPDPRYEKIYKDQQRYEDQSLIRETVQRNPNDLRYNLMRRKSDGDRDGGRDGRERQSTMMDARSRIEARRQGHPDDYSDRRDRSGERRGPQGSPPRRIERKNASVKTDLPDFKNRPGVKLEKPVVWVIGSAVIKDLKQFGKVFPNYDMSTLLKDDVSSLVIHGEMDMKIEDILPAVKYLLKNNKPPQMIVLQCGELDISVGRNVDFRDIITKDLATIKELIPDVVMVWSQILPPWMVKDKCGSTLAKSRRRINRFMMQCFVSDEVCGCFLYQNMLRSDLKLKYHMPTSDGFLHLRKAGMQVFISQLKSGIRYFISGHGSIFPYIKWPLKKSEVHEFDPQHMCMLNKEHIQSLDAGMLGRLTKEQVQMLSNDQILMFHNYQFPYVFCEEFVQKLSQKQLSGLSRDNFLHLTISQIKLFTDNPERVQCMSEEVVNFLNKRIMGSKKVENTGDKKECTLGDLISSASDDDYDLIEKKERDWVVENAILAPMNDESHYKQKERGSWRGRRSFFRGRGRGRGWDKSFHYSREHYGRSRTWDRYRPNSSEHYGTSSRNRYRSKSGRRFGRSRSRDRSRSNSGEHYKRSRSHDRSRSSSREHYKRSRSRDRSRSSSKEWSRSRDRSRSSSGEHYGRSRSHDRSRSSSREHYGRSRSHDRSRSRSRERSRRDRYRSKSRDRYNRSRSREKRDRHGRKSSKHGLQPVQTVPFPGQYPGMVIPQYGMLPGPFPPMPFHGMPMPQTFPPGPFPGAWPGVPMSGMPPVAPPVGPLPVPVPIKETNWGDGPSSNVTSINTKNLTEINQCKD